MSNLKYTRCYLQRKRLKTWQRQWKIDLINEFNPDWLDLYENILD